MTNEEFDEILERTNAVVCNREWYERAAKALEKELKYCDRNICTSNEYNGIGCDKCEVTKSQEKIDKAIADIKNIDLIVHDGINHYYKSGEEVKAEVLVILKRNIGE